VEESGQLHGPATLPPSKSARFQLDRRLGGPQSRCEREGKRKFHYYPCQEPNPGRPARTVVSILTELPRLINMWMCT
jgi:hypothetical protein